MKYQKQLVLFLGIMFIFILGYGLTNSIFQYKKILSVSVEEGCNLDNAKGPKVYIPPNGVSENTNLVIEEVDVPKSYDAEQVSSSYNLSLEGGNLRKSIEIALPIENKRGDILNEDEYFIAYLDENNQWVSLPSWYSEDDGMIHATMSHFTIVSAFRSLIPSRPKITLKEVLPNPIAGVGVPPCFQEDLIVRVGAQDPNDDINKVEVRLRLHTLTTRGVENMVRFTEVMNSLELVMVAGDPTALLPMARTTIIQFTMKDKGSIGTDWLPLDLTGEENIYAGKINMSALSNCEGEFDVDAIMATIGLEKIDVEIRVTDRSGREREDLIEVPVYSNTPAYAVLQNPGPTIQSVQSSRPTFEWLVEIHDVSSLDYREIRLVYAKGNVLWERIFGKNIIELGYFDREWIPDFDLSPGEYVWGIEVISDKVTTRSNVYSFTVSKLWTDLSLNGDLIRRTDVTGNHKGISWEIYRNGELVLSRVADHEMEIDLKERLGSKNLDGFYEIWIEAVTEDIWGNRSSTRISNIVTLQIEPTPTPTSTSTSTPTPSPTPSPTKTPTPKPTPRPTNTPSSYSSGGATLYLDQNYFCRVSPSSSAEDVTAFEKGSRFPILATTNTGWWLIKINLSWTRHTSCWIGGGIPEGDYSSVDIVQPATGVIPIYDYYHLEYHSQTFTLSCNELSQYRWGREIYDSGFLLDSGPFYWDGDLVLQVYDCPRCPGDPKVFLASEGHQACPDIVR